MKDADTLRKNQLTLLWVQSKEGMTIAPAF